MCWHVSDPELRAGDKAHRRVMLLEAAAKQIRCRAWKGSMMDKSGNTVWQICTPLEGHVFKGSRVKAVMVHTRCCHVLIPLP